MYSVEGLEKTGKNIQAALHKKKKDQSGEDAKYHQTHLPDFSRGAKRHKMI